MNLWWRIEHWERRSQTKSVFRAPAILNRQLLRLISRGGQQRGGREKASQPRHRKSSCKCKMNWMQII